MPKTPTTKLLALLAALILIVGPAARGSFERHLDAHGSQLASTATTLDHPVRAHDLIATYGGELQDFGRSSLDCAVTFLDPFLSRGAPGIGGLILLALVARVLSGVLAWKEFRVLLGRVTVLALLAVVAAAVYLLAQGVLPPIQV